LLDKINSTKDIKKLNIDELKMLADEIRSFLIDNISVTGGHLASNLGVVELTLALHKVFDFPSDKIVFDVGHQSYVHKIITGRKDEFATLRKFGGLSGFPKVKESEYDFFDTGHSSNSLSVAMGMRRAADLNGDKNNIIAFLGDGSFGGGMIYEAINDAGQKKDKIIIILNDNQMSISKNKSGISKYLNKVRLKSSYINAKNKVETHLPDSFVKNIIVSVKNLLRRIVVKNNFFEDLGLLYYGPYDGHNIEELIEIFETAKKIKRPVIIHTLTKKGKGYHHAESNPEKFHGISQFDIKTGEKLSSIKDFSSVFGEKLVKIAEKNNKVVAVTAAMSTGTGLLEFSKKFKNRFYDVGICEEHAVSMCGGLAAYGYIPVFAVYSSFLQRGYDQIITDVALMNLHVVFAVDRAGIVGEDGETHQGMFDISYLRSIPNMTVLSPVDFEELKIMLDYAVNEIKGPVAIRYPRGKESVKLSIVSDIGKCKAEILNRGNDLTIVAEGRMVSTAYKLRDLFVEDGKDADIINLRFIKPIDIETIRESVRKTKRLVIIEEGIKSGGVGEEIISSLSGESFLYVHKHLPDKFIEHGSCNELIKLMKLDEESILKEVKEVFDF